VDVESGGATVRAIIAYSAVNLFFAQGEWAFYMNSKNRSKMRLGSSER